MKTLPAWRLIANVLVWACRRTMRTLGVAHMLLPLFWPSDIAYGIMRSKWGATLETHFAAGWQKSWELIVS